MTDMTDIYQDADYQDAQSADRQGRAATDLDAHVTLPAPAGEHTTGVTGTAISTDQAIIDDIEEALKDVVDPELGINIAACPLTDMIEDQVAAALVGGPDGGLVADFRINWVWLPPWGPEKITEDGREQMRALGFNI